MEINKEKLIELLEDDYGTGYWEGEDFKCEGVFLMRRNYDHLISLIKKCEGKETPDELPDSNCIKHAVIKSVCPINSSIIVEKCIYRGEKCSVCIK